MSQPFTLGVNYWPRRKAMYWWSDFDATEVDEEFALLSELGLHLVRVFLLWDDWQPAPDQVSPACMRNFETVCETAQKYGLKLDVTFFTGHMSGPNWSPSWLLSGNQLNKRVQQLVSGGQIVTRGYRNPFSDAEAIAAEQLLLRTVVSTFRSHPAIGMWNLGNEPDLFAWPDTASEGRAWVRNHTQLIKAIDAQHPVTCGLHVASLLENNNLRVHDVYGETDVAVMHAYPMYLPWSRHPLDPDLVPYTCALVTALSGKPTLMEEFGGCTAAPGEKSYTWEWTAYGRPRTQFMASEEDFAEYIAAVLPKLVEVGATGAMTWCFADYVEALWDKPPCSESKHERFFGLVRPDGSLKPHADVIKKFAASKPTVLESPKRSVTLPYSPDDYYLDPAGNAVKLYHEYLASDG
ncbi:MAG: glycoside hydrolase family 2 TIM barrel-domain containing protein [Caldilineaceae bacterium]